MVPPITNLETDEPLPPHVRDIDAGEEDDPTLVAIYTRSVYRHLLEVEVTGSTALALTSSNRAAKVALLAVSLCNLLACDTAAKVPRGPVLHGHAERH